MNKEIIMLIASIVALTVIVLIIKFKIRTKYIKERVDSELYKSFRLVRFIIAGLFFILVFENFFKEVKSFLMEPNSLSNFSDLTYLLIAVVQLLCGIGVVTSMYIEVQRTKNLTS